MGIVVRKLVLLDRLARLHRVRRRNPDDEDLVAVIVGIEADLGATVSQRVAAHFLGISHTEVGRRVRTGEVPLVENPEGAFEVPVPVLLRTLEGRDTSPAPSPVRTGAVARSDPAARSLDYHRALSEALTPDDVADARYRVHKWRNQGTLAPVYADRWEHLLSLPLEQIRGALNDTTEAAADLRQNTPFVGVLSELERRSLLETAS